MKPASLPATGPSTSGALTVGTGTSCSGARVSGGRRTRYMQIVIAGYS
jgi:hypothetical protein